MPDLPLVSVIIVHYNDTRFLHGCLTNIFKTKYPNFEVLFVDNGSTDNSIDFLKKHFGKESKLKILRNQRNLGFTGGNNIGWKVARGDYLVLLNDDTKVDKNWLSEVIKVMQNDSTIGIAQCKLLLMLDPKRFDGAGQMSDFYGFAIARGNKEIDHGQYDEIKEIFSASGAALVIRSKILNEIGGLFDDDYFLYHEDLDLCWRAWLRGHRTVFVPKSIVFHAREASLYKVNKVGTQKTDVYYRRSAFFMERNNLLSLLKNYSTSTLLKILPRYFSLSTAEFILFIALLKIRFATAVIRAYIWNVINFKKTWKKHLIIQQNRLVSDDVIMKKMLKGSMRVQQFAQLFITVQKRYKTP